MQNPLVLRLYFPYRKQGEFQAGAEQFAVACWNRETPKKAGSFRDMNPHAAWRSHLFFTWAKNNLRNYNYSINRKGERF